MKVGDVKKNNKEEEYKLIEYMGDAKWRTIFISTGYEDINYETTIKRGTLKNNRDKLLGKVFESNSFGNFKVIQIIRKNGQGHKWYKLRFLGTGFEIITNDRSISSGSVKDYLAKSIYGVGCLGKKGASKENRRLYGVWRSMISRCYNKEDNGYKSYGGKGITVCDRWHNFSNFIEDVPKIDGFNEDVRKVGSIYQLDKDMKQSNVPPSDKVYSLETCKFIKRNLNARAGSDGVKYFKALSPDGEICYSNSQRGFSRENNLSVPGVNMCLKSKANSHKGWTFQYISKEEYEENNT